MTLALDQPRLKFGAPYGHYRVQGVSSAGRDLNTFLMQLIFEKKKNKLTDVRGTTKHLRPKCHKFV